jgi:hypothetical protein
MGGESGKQSGSGSLGEKAWLTFWENNPPYYGFHSAFPA